MSKKASEMYECDFCGKKFEHQVTFKHHKKYCGKRRLSEFDESNELSRLDAMNGALHKNDYDKLETVKSKQTSIKSY